jgi:hypothetical protein
VEFEESKVHVEVRMNTEIFTGVSLHSKIHRHELVKQQQQEERWTTRTRQRGGVRVGGLRHSYQGQGVSCPKYTVTRSNDGESRQTDITRQ